MLAFYPHDITGSYWTHPVTGEERVYLDDWRQLVGIEFDYYKTGNIRHAYLGGEKVSNNVGYSLQNIRVWLDQLDRVHVDGLNERAGRYISEGEIADVIETALFQPEYMI